MVIANILLISKRKSPPIKENKMDLTNSKAYVFTIVITATDFKKFTKVGLCVHRVVG